MCLIYLWPPHYSLPFTFGVEYTPPGLEHLVAIVVTDGTPDEPRLL